MIGGALFLDMARGDFFQRSWCTDEIDTMRREMADGLPAERTVEDGDKICISTTLPSGVWEVRMVEVDPDAHAIGVTLYAAGEAGEDAATGPSLRLERTFALPLHADAVSAAIALEEDGRLCVRFDKKKRAAMFKCAVQATPDPCKCTCTCKWSWRFHRPE